MNLSDLVNNTYVRVAAVAIASFLLTTLLLDCGGDGGAVVVTNDAPTTEATTVPATITSEQSDEGETLSEGEILEILATGEDANN